MEEKIHYIAQPRIRYTPDAGTYTSYDLSACTGRENRVIATVFDVTTDCAAAQALAERFTRLRLSPLHLQDAVLDVLSDVPPPLPTRCSSVQIENSVYNLKSQTPEKGD